MIDRLAQNRRLLPWRVMSRLRGNRAVTSTYSHQVLSWAVGGAVARAQRQPDERDAADVDL